MGGCVIKTCPKGSIGAFKNTHPLKAKCQLRCQIRPLSYILQNIFIFRPSFKNLRGVFLPSGQVGQKCVYMDFKAMDDIGVVMTREV